MNANPSAAVLSSAVHTGDSLRPESYGQCWNAGVHWEVLPILLVLLQHRKQRLAQVVQPKKIKVIKMNATKQWAMRVCSMHLFYLFPFTLG